MSVRSLLGAPPSDNAIEEKLVRRFGVAANPFPATEQTIDHPRRAVDGVDARVIDSVKEFEQTDHRSQVFVIEGSQGVGKTNLLNTYQSLLREYFEKDSAYYIIRYYSDPEPDFDRIIRKVFQELGASFIERLVKSLAELPAGKSAASVANLRSIDLRVLLTSLTRLARNEPGELTEATQLAFEWLVGQRLLNRHRDALGVQFRLDTVESRTQALHDVVFLSGELGLLKGIFLLLDELEKQGSNLPNRGVVQYLSAIRALIDSLPRFLFMVLAMTPDARVRYFEMIPALQSRLKETIMIPPLQTSDEANALCKFYLDEARARVRGDRKFEGIPIGNEDMFSTDVVAKQFQQLYENEATTGFTGVTQREFLGRMHDLARETIRRT